jgi:hypothetical protein
MIARSELAGHRCGVATTRGDGVARPQQPVRPAAQEQRGASPRGRRTATAARWRRDRTRADPPGALHWTGARVWETRTTGCPVLTRVLTRRDTCEPARCTDTGCVSGRTRVDVSADRSLPGGRQSCSQTLELCTRGAGRSEWRRGHLHLQELHTLEGIQSVPLRIVPRTPHGCAHSHTGSHDSSQDLPDCHCISTYRRCHAGGEIHVLIAARRQERGSIQASG